MGIRHALIVALGLLAVPCTAADDAALAVQRIKAAFLSKFASYVEWPAGAFAGPESPIVIGVARSEAIARELEQAVAGRSVGSRAMEVRRIAGSERGRGCCHILFVGAEADRATAAALLAGAEGQPVLVVTDAGPVQPAGSVINFFEGQDRVRFDISRAAAERNGLQLRSQLLTVARQVTPQ